MSLEISPITLSAALAVSGVLLVGNEFASKDLLLYTDTQENQVTGQLRIDAPTRGINPLLFGAGILALTYGTANGIAYSKERESTAIQPIPASNVAVMREKPPITAINYAQPQKVAAKKQAKDDRDLLTTMAEYGKSILLFAVTGAGKTTLLHNAIREAMRINEAINILVIDPKFSNWNLPNENFEDGKTAIIYPEPDDATPMPDFDLKTTPLEEFAERVLWVLNDFLSARKKTRLQCERSGQPYNPPKTILIFDEFLALQVLLESQWEAKRVKDFNNKIKRIIVEGREDNVLVWLISQSHQCGELNMSGSVRGNLGIVGLAAPDNAESLEAMATDSYLVKSAQKRQALEGAIAKRLGTYFYVSTLKGGIEVGATPQPKKSNKLSTTADPWDAAA